MRWRSWTLCLVVAVGMGCGSSSGSKDLGPGDVAGDPGADVPGLDLGTDATVDPGTDLAEDPGSPADTAGEGAPDTAPDVEPDVVDDTPADVATDVPWTRPEKGEPVAASEIQRITDLYIDLLKQTRYFDVLDERVHGWPQSDPQGRYWYGTWWSGVRILKENGKIRYLHSADGADNNGMRTGPMLVGACYAAKLWGQPRDVGLLRKIVRGFQSWTMAFRSPTHPDWETKRVLSRAAYPEAIQSSDGGREFLIDYSLNRPGEDNGACSYVHVADNPNWGDLYAKNKRSKDDIGHMMLGIAMLPACVPDAVAESDPALDALMQDRNEMVATYRQWAQQVDADGWKIATVDAEGKIYYPDEDLAYLWLSFGNIECEGAVALRLFGGGDPADLECGNGICELDEVEGLKSDVHQIERSFHEAAVAHAWLAGRKDVATELLTGLAWRVDVNLDRLEAPTPPANVNLSDLGELVLMAGNVGLPLTWREVRFLHQRIEAAYAALVTPYDDAAKKRRYDVFAPDLPDGEYPFDPGDTGLAWRYLGALLGTCASPYWSADSHTLLDCDRVRAAFPVGG